ncbi:MAG: nitroreductase [Spirochaetes bacterium]|nr:nitroreductase [Spirochaetota bacterium]
MTSSIQMRFPFRMNEIIRKRKSIRKFNPAKLDAETLEKVAAQIAALVPLYPNIRYSIEIAEKTKGFFNIKAPHYLLFYSEETEGFLENIGFIGQQMDLFFSGSGLGSCWLGASKPAGEEARRKKGELSFVICMAFGKPAGALHRELGEFKRKALGDISEGCADARLEAVRLAPSGVNAQNWYFIAEAGGASGAKIHCFCKKPGVLLRAIMSKLSRIDMGIALCHIAAESKDFRFLKDANAPARKGCVYIGTVTS